MRVDLISLGQLGIGQVPYKDVKIHNPMSKYFFIIIGGHEKLK